MANNIDTGLSGRDADAAGEVGAVVTARLARVGRAILLTGIAIALIAAVLSSASEHVMSPAAMVMMGAAIALAATLLLNERGHPRAALVIVVVILFVLMIGITQTRGTVRAPAASLIILATAIASLAFNMRGLIVTLVSGVAILGGLTYADARGLLGPVSEIPLISFWFSVSAFALFTGVIVRYGRLVAEDALLRTRSEIAEHKHARADLARASELLQRTGELARVGGWELEIPSMALYWSPETCRIHEIDPPVTPSLEAAINFYAPEARPVIQAAVKAGMDQGTPWDIELPLITAKGERLWVRAQGTALKEGGKTVKLLGSFQDITGRKQADETLRKSEEQLRLALRGGDLALWDVNMITGELSVNERWLSMLGLDIKGPMPTMSAWRSMIHPDDLPMVDGAFSAIESRSSHEFAAEIRARHTDGHMVWILKKGAVVEQGTDGTPLRVAGTHMDITARKQAESARATLEAQLREAQKMQAIGTLAGGIAHDFNNIITIILGNTDLARRAFNDHPDALESLNEIQKAAARARDLVQQILSFSRRRSAEKKPIALEPVIEESVRLLRATLPPRLTLQVDCERGIPLIMGDATLIQQVVINLATNAMQAMSNGPGRIHIRLDSVLLDAVMASSHAALSILYASHPGRTVRLTVSDNGPGMDAATLDRIFDPFFTTKPTDEGTGLGLSVVHGITQAHEGVIIVASQPGKGATFTLYLPAAESSEVATTLDNAVATRSEVAQTSSGQHMAYIDDDAALVRVISRLLERRGFRISGYTNPYAALTAIRADPGLFDVVVTDYNMPGMSGLDVAREVRKIRADLPIAVASGFVDEVLHAQAGEAGVNRLIFKASAVEDICDALAGLALSVGKSPSTSPAHAP